MSPTKARLCDRLAEPTLTVKEMSTGVLSAFNPQMRQAVASCVRVVADEAADWYWKSDTDFWDFDEDHFGPLRLPFDSLWIEWDVPEIIHADGVITSVAGDPAFSGRRGAALRNVARDSREYYELVRLVGMPGGRSYQAPPGTENVVLWRFFREEMGIVTVPDMIGVMPMNADGKVLETMQITSYRGTTLDVLGPILWTEVKAALLAVSLMNCRNITLDHVQPVRPVSKKQRRPRAPFLDYHTIVLPQQKRSASTAQRSAAMGGAIPLHKVRGHFKTYTEDAPRFGRDVGTFWYGWHVRGDADNGQVISDYKVGLPSR